MAGALEACYRKAAYESKADALRSLAHRKAVSEHSTRPLVAYWCVFCGKFHVGHRKRKNRYTW